MDEVFRQQPFATSATRKTGLFDESARRPNVQQLAGMLSTPGGKLFLESNKKIFPQELLGELRPYLGQPPNSDFKLGRENLTFE